MRDRYRILGEDDLILLVSTDRISAFDVVMKQGIAGRGRILTALSRFFFEYLTPDIPNHLVERPELEKLYKDSWIARSMLARKAEMVPVECIVRGYMAGSAWAEYQAEQSVSGQKLERGLQLGSELAQPIFTPSTKAEHGHDIALQRRELESVVGVELANTLESTSLHLYGRAASYAISRGLVLADSKFEFGFIDGKLHLCDEILTPDSSRYWQISGGALAQPPLQFDKQILRDWLEGSSWDRVSPPPDLPDQLVREVKDAYIKIYESLTRSSFTEIPGTEPEGGYLGEGAGVGVRDH